MRLFDERFRDHRAKYLLQCALATCAVLLVLLVLDLVSDAVIIASLGASSFIAFTMPSSQTSRPRFLVGGYLIGTVVGCVCHYLSVLPVLVHVHVARLHSDALFGALAVGLSTFLMVVTDTEHPPAAGLALGFVLSGWDVTTVTVVVVGIISLSLIKKLLEPALIDLL